MNLERKGVGRRLGVPGLALLLAACGAGSPGTTGLPSTLASDSGELPTSPDVSAEATSALPTTNEEAWRSISIPPRPAGGVARALTAGFDGGLLALSEQVDPRDGDQGFSGSKLVVWHVSADGTLDPAFAGDGSVTYTRGNPYEQWDIGGFERRSSDGSLILLSSVSDSGSDQYTSAYRVSRDGIVDDAYQTAHEPLLDRPDSDTYRMTTIGDGSVRYCSYSQLDVTLWGISSDGAEDTRLGPGGSRNDMLVDARCGGVDTYPDGSLVVGFMHVRDEPRCDSTPYFPQIELARLDAQGSRDADWGGEPFPMTPATGPDNYRTYEAQQILVTADGATYVAGITWGEDECGNPRGDASGFIVRADPDGNWDRAFGNEGIIELDLSSVVGLAHDGEHLAVTFHEEVQLEGTRTRFDGGLLVFDAQTGVPTGPARRFRDRLIAGPVIQGPLVAVFATGAIERFPLGS